MGSFAPIAHPCLSVMSLWNKPLCKALKGVRTAVKKKAKLKKDGMTERTQMTTIDHLCLFLLYVVMRPSWFHSAAISKPSPDKIDDFRGPLDWSGQIWQILKPDVRSGPILVKSAHA